MGADLLLTGLVHDENTRLNWPAGRAVIKRMPEDQLRAALEEIYGNTVDMTLTECRQYANSIISDLKAEITNNHSRDAHCWRIRGAILHIRGGTSWGEDPSDGWTTFVDVQQLPGVVQAIGFEQEE